MKQDPTDPLHHQTKHPEFAPKQPLIGTVFDFSDKALGEVRGWLELNPPKIPVTQIEGFTQYTIRQAASIGATETTTSTSFTDLTTVGPQITGLPDGTYQVTWGCAATSAAGDEADMGVDANGTGVDATVAAITKSTSFTSISVSAVMSLSNGGSNTLTAKYLSVAGGTASFGRRWLIALRVSN